MPTFHSLHPAQVSKNMDKKLNKYTLAWPSLSISSSLLSKVTLFNITRNSLLIPEIAIIT